MPLNEAGGHTSHLTQEQQREAERAIYGLQKDPMKTETPLTYEERVVMRRMLDRMDQEAATGGMGDFDLNKPKVPPYAYREYPYLLYNHAEKTTKAARDADERAQMLAEGWSESPFPAPAPEVQLTAAERAEAAEIESRLEKKGKR